MRGPGIGHGGSGGACAEIGVDVGQGGLGGGACRVQGGAVVRMVEWALIRAVHAVREMGRC